jgi:predicted nucleic acid-binding protein
MSFILDTSAYSAFNRGDKRLRAWFTPDRDIIVPILVLGELRSGFAVGNRFEENEKLLQRFLDSPNVTVQTITDKTTVIYSQIYLKLRAIGRPIGTNDMWIAAIALELDNELLTLDEDFANVPDLMIGKI